MKPHFQCTEPKLKREINFQVIKKTRVIAGSKIRILKPIVNYYVTKAAGMVTVCAKINSKPLIVMFLEVV